MPGEPAPKPDLTAAEPELGVAVRATGLVTLGSRVLGLVRDVLLGRIFGDTAVGSAFAAAFAIPNMFRRLFGEGALSAAFIPEYVEAHKHDKPLARVLSGLTLQWLAIITGLLTAAIELVLLAVLIFAPGDEERRLSIGLLMVMLPFMPMICVVAILAGMLQIHGRYALAASGPVLLNAFIIVTGLFFTFRGEIGGTGVAYALAVATVLSGLTQALTFWWILQKARADEPPLNAAARAEARTRARQTASRMLRTFVPVMVGLGTLQLSTFVDTLIAMWPIWVGPTILGTPVPLDERSNVILSLTARLYQFPLGVFGIAVATAAFPLLARAADTPAAFIDVLRRGLRLSLLIGLPAGVGLALVRDDLVTIMYGPVGASQGFSREGLQRAANVLLGFSVGVWAYSLNHVLTRAFYARKDTKTPMKLALAMVGLTIAINLVLIWPLREAGLAWGTAISQMIQTMALLLLAGRMLRREAGLTGWLLDRPTLAAMARIVLATIIMAAGVLITLHFWPATHQPLRWMDRVLRLAVCCGVGGGIYLAMCLAMRSPELSWLLRRRAA
ncbi:MAG: murein biosynthesis integral membrane protein MurJ [Phycisphaerales bacterium]|jgi:putative peptidoglycan lipid II flippase|nr:murein biosynthesis integral membrane protein MurJ [Phycisphaerales bacterium]